MHQRKIAVHALTQVLVANLLFFVVDWYSKSIETSMPNGVGQKLILGSHLLIVLLMVFIIARFFQQVDEYLRLQMLENLAVTTALIFIGACLYGSLEAMGFPRLSMFVICPALGTVFAIVSVARKIAIR